MSTSARLCSAGAAVAVALLLYFVVVSDPGMQWRGSTSPSVLESGLAIGVREPTECSAEKLESPGIPDGALRTTFSGGEEAPEIVVCVQDASSGDPVVGASLIVDSEQDHGGEAPRSTDENGVAVVRVRRVDPTRPILTARHGRLFGELWSDSKSVDGIHTLYLHSDAAVVAHVSHVDGAPVPGAAVELQVRTWPVEKPSLEVVTILSQLTDTRGIATFPHVNARVRRHSAGAELGASFVAVLPGLGVSSVLLPLNIEEQQVTLVRPATSSASLHIEGGHPNYLLGAVCRVRPVDASGADRSRRAEVSFKPDGTELSNLLPSVSYSVELSHWDRVVGRAAFVAAQPGRSTEIALHLDNWRAVSASLVNEDGGVVFDKHVTLSMKRGTEIAVYHCKTDRAGLVTVSVDASDCKGFACQWAIASAWPDLHSGMRSASFVLGDDRKCAEGFPPTRVSHDGLRVLAQGRVLDDRGHALGPSRMRALRCNGAPGLLDVSFVPLSGESEPGEFCALGEIVDSAFVIQAVGLGWIEEVMCVKGANDVRIVHVRECHLNALIQGDAAASLRVVLRKCIGNGGNASLAPAPATVRGGLSLPSAAPGARTRREPSRVRRVKGGYEFCWQSLDEGVYDLEVQALGSSDACFVMPSIVVKPGECTDPRLKRISLGSAVRVVNAFLLQQDGSRLTGNWLAVARVAKEPAEGMMQSVQVVSRDSRMSLFADNVASEITVFIDGFKPVVLPRGATDLAVDLTPQ